VAYAGLDVSWRSHLDISVDAWFSEAADAIVSVFFPAGCRLCDQLLTRATRVPICDLCLAAVAPLGPDVCQTCGAPRTTPFAAGGGPSDVEVDVEEPSDTEPELGGCLQCQGRTLAFERALSYAAYEAQLARCIILLKFERIEPLARYMAQKLAVVAKQESLDVDLVVPVPLHRQRESERGYNQAGLIARPLAARLGVPYRAVLLVRTKPRPEKRILSFSERWASVRGAFATHPGSQVDNLRVLLIDDVMTTGATLDACSRALLKAGAKSVIGLTVARTVRHPQSSSDEF
jgi:competence protein ComFC